MHYLTAMQTNAFLGTEMYQVVMGKACDSFANGDQTSTMIRTVKGKTMLIQHNVMTPRPYSRMFQAVGTAGYAAKYPVPEVQLSPEMAAKVGIEMEDESYLERFSDRDTTQSLCTFFPFRDNYP